MSEDTQVNLATASLATSYNTHMLDLVRAGLAALVDAQQAKRSLQNPLAETHFLGNWIITALKQKRFDSCLAADLNIWLQESRTLGPKADFKSRFEKIAKVYEQICELEYKNLNQFILEDILNELDAEGWLIATDMAVTPKMKLSSSGENSLVICAEVYDRAFSDTDGVLESPLSVFIRHGDQAFIDKMFAHGYLVFSSSTRSLVKRHNRFIIRPFNDAHKLALLPSFL